MKFDEAMKELELGKRVTRKVWENKLYFSVKDSGFIQCYQPTLSAYVYDETIMNSEDWYIDDMFGKFKFYEMVPFLYQGFRAFLDGWEDNFICFDKPSRSLVIQAMKEYSFMPDFDSFIADDWMILE